MRKLLIAAALVLPVLTSASLAQDQLPTLKPANPVKTPEPPVFLVLEVSYNPGLSPAYLDIYGATETPTWIWVTRFVRAQDWQLKEGSLPIRAVRLQPQFNGETTDVRVTVLRGRSSIEKEELVDTYHLGTGESRMLTGLQSFGVEPFTIKVGNFVTPLPSAPVLDIRTGAVEIAGIVPLNVPLPAYRVKFRNLTAKRISALKVDVVNGPSAFFRGEEGRALIEPGEIHEEYLTVTKAVQQGNSNVPGTADVNTILVSSAVFDDGTFDGDVGAACTLESISLGSLLWLKRIVPLLEQQVTENDSSPTDLKEKVKELQLESSDVEKKKPSSVSTSCPSPGSFISSGAKSQRLAFLRELDQIISTRPAPPVNYKSWLQTTRNRYVAWLTRIERSTH